jgi:23S rRNA (adenine2030-N6)-methyltransferase
MNYRHAFHAGNFADVVKHAVLARIVQHLRRKDAAFRIIDTHAGAGVYDLSGADASRSGEWRDGIARVFDAEFDSATAALLAPYLDAVRAANPDGALRRYPGSPALVRSLLRPQDRMIACELEPGAAAALARNLRGDARIKVIKLDGWMALSAYIPPKERRGLVLIDPPFEARDEYGRLADALAAALRKWPDGVYLAWYPIKAQADIADFRRRLVQIGLGKMLRVELILAAPQQSAKLRGTGLIIGNPPWTLEDDIKMLLAALARVLAPQGKPRVLVGPVGSQPRRP